jgi:hypothetical protein
MKRFLGTLTVALLLSLVAITVVGGVAFGAIVDSRFQAESMTRPTSADIILRDESTDDGSHIRFTANADATDRASQVVNPPLSTQVNQIQIRSRQNAGGVDDLAVYVNNTPVGVIQPNAGSTWTTQSVNLTTPLDAGSSPTISIGPDQPNNNFVALDWFELHNTAPCTVGCEPADEEGAYWQMDDTSGQMLDSSGNNNNGTPTNVGQTGSRYVFNGTNSYVTVPDSDSLDPEGKDITLSAGVTVTDAPMNDDSYDVVRKGLSATPGGDYKMEIMQRTSNPSVGRLHCLFKGTGGKVDIVAQRDIVDGNFHKLECIKTSTSVEARIDGEIGGTAAGSAGSISNASNVMVGAKTANPLDDVFNGSMDFVSIDIAQ